MQRRCSDGPPRQRRASALPYQISGHLEGIARGVEGGVEIRFALSRHDPLRRHVVYNGRDRATHAFSCGRELERGSGGFPPDGEVGNARFCPSASTLVQCSIRCFVRPATRRPHLGKPKLTLLDDDNDALSALLERADRCVAKCGRSLTARRTKRSTSAQVSDRAPRRG